MTTCTPSFEPVSGALINDNLQLVRPIAEGGMGSVWLARHTGLDLLVAMKFMSPSIFQDEPDAVERFTREARAAARIRHPNVVRIFDFRFQTQAEEPPYMVMELLEGENLERRIRRCGQLDVREVVAIVRAIAGVLEKAHEHGIVHRDIKPENVFLEGPERTVKVLDFGVAKIEPKRDESISEAEGTIFGTPCFMSPEQFANAEHVDHRCDLWALAVVAYEALTGRTPFAGETLSAIFLAAARARYTAPSEVRRELGPAIDAWFRKAFASKLEYRFASARELADAFAHAATEQPAAVEMPGTLGQFEGLSARNGSRWSRWAAVSTGLFAGVVATLAFTAHLRGASESMAASAPPPAAPVAFEPAVAPTAPVPSASCAVPLAPLPAPRARAVAPRSPIVKASVVAAEEDESDSEEASFEGTAPNEDRASAL